MAITSDDLRSAEQAALEILSSVEVLCEVIRRACPSVDKGTGDSAFFVRLTNKCFQDLKEALHYWQPESSVVSVLEQASVDDLQPVSFRTVVTTTGCEAAWLLGAILQDDYFIAVDWEYRSMSTEAIRLEDCRNLVKETADVTPELLRDLKGRVQVERIRAERFLLEQAGIDATATSSAPNVGKKRRKTRVKRTVAEPLILSHLIRRPYDTVVDVAEAVGCSTGIVGEAPGWKANQRRLRDAKARGKKPTELPLKDYLTEAGDNAAAQRRHHKEQEAALDDNIELREKELFQRIGEYEKQHPEASQDDVATGVGCSLNDVRRRKTILDRLQAEQTESQRQDIAPSCDSEQRQEPA